MPPTSCYRSSFSVILISCFRECTPTEVPHCPAASSPYLVAHPGSPCSGPPVTAARALCSLPLRVLRALPVHMRPAWPAQRSFPLTVPTILPCLKLLIAYSSFHQNLVTFSDVFLSGPAFLKFSRLSYL